MVQPRLVWFIALKDLKLFTRDRMALFFFVLFPFMFVILFNFLLSDAFVDEDNRLVFHLITLEEETETAVSHQIIAALVTPDESSLRPGEPLVIEVDDYDELRRQVEEKELGGFLAFPEDFTESLYAGGGADIEVVADPEAVYHRAALHGLAQGISSWIGAEYAVRGAIIELAGEQAQAILQSLEGQVITGEPLIGYTSDNTAGDIVAEQPTNYVIPGYLVMFVFFAAALSAEAIVRERQNHTLERMLASSVRRSTLIGGIFTGTAAKGLVQIIIFWTVGILVFNIDLGVAPAAVIILSFLMVIVSAAFGVMLATLVKTDRSAGSLATLSALIMAPLGGCWWPLFIAPQWLQSLAKITPHGWANTGFNKLMLFGADFADVGPELLALVVFTIVFASIAVWRFRTAAS
ncbi:MAG: ABC transporter permease [Dehalococcoidales bacterium]|nr:MAG: ABC transporter permease [Dehalococcoidales bacterium]